jgi:hypothetical protein
MSRLPLQVVCEFCQKIKYIKVVWQYGETDLKFWTWKLLTKSVGFENEVKVVKFVLAKFLQKTTFCLTSLVSDHRFCGACIALFCIQLQCSILQSDHIFALGLCRTRHDLTATCRQGITRQMHIKSNCGHSILFDTEYAWSTGNCILDICLALLFQVNFKWIICRSSLFSQNSCKRQHFA